VRAGFRLHAVPVLRPQIIQIIHAEGIHHSQLRIPHYVRNDTGVRGSE
jgi:hypothetical protein